VLTADRPSGRTAHDDQETGNEARRGLLTTLALLGTAFVATLSVQCAALVAPRWFGRTAAAYSSVWPQGWGFFDDSADMDTLSVYRWVGPSELGASELPLYMSSENSWGLGRVAAARQNQAKDLVARTPGSAWISCNVPNSNECLSRLVQVDTVNAYQAPLLCGRQVLVRSRPSTGPDGAPLGGEGLASSVALVNVACSAER
jgi:hypothetical protein